MGRTHVPDESELLLFCHTFLFRRSTNETRIKQNLEVHEWSIPYDMFIKITEILQVKKFCCSMFRRIGFDILQGLAQLVACVPFSLVIYNSVNIA